MGHKKKDLGEKGRPKYLVSGAWGPYAQGKTHLPREKFE